MGLQAMHLTGSQLENDIVIYMLPGLPVKLISPAGRYEMFRRRGIFSISRGLANVWFGIHSFQTVPLRLEASRTPCKYAPATEDQPNYVGQT